MKKLSALSALLPSPPSDDALAAQGQVLNLQRPPLTRRTSAVRQLHQGDRHHDPPRRRRRCRGARAPAERGRIEPGRRGAARRRGAALARRGRRPVPARSGPSCSSPASRRTCAARMAARARSGSASRHAPASSSSTRRAWRGGRRHLRRTRRPGRTRARSARARARIRTTCRCSAPSSSRWARRDRAVAARHRRQHGAPAQGRRHRPDQGRRQRRVPDRARQHLLPRPPDALRQARGQGGGGEDRSSSPTRRGAGTHVNIAGGAVAKNAHHRAAAVASSNTWQATRLRPTSPTATTNGPRSRA